MGMIISAIKKALYFLMYSTIEQKYVCNPALTRKLIDTSKMQFNAIVFCTNRIDAVFHYI